MIDRDKDPCASKQQGVASQHQVTRRGIKKSSKRHDDFMKALFRSRIAGRVTVSLRALVWRALLLAGRMLFPAFRRVFRQETKRRSSSRAAPLMVFVCSASNTAAFRFAGIPIVKDGDGNCLVVTASMP
jgi:hypothetical protein